MCLVLEFSRNGTMLHTNAGLITRDILCSHIYSDFENEPLASYRPGSTPKHMAIILLSLLDAHCIMWNEWVHCSIKSVQERFVYKLKCYAAVVCFAVPVSTFDVYDNLP